MSNIWILSFKYSPGLMKEILCLEHCFKHESYNVKLVLNPDYQVLGLSSPELDAQRTTYLDGLYNGYGLVKKLISTQPKILFFYNSHPFNFLFMLLGLVFCRNSRRVLVLHEPNKKNVIKNYGFHGFIVSLITLFNKLQSWFCTDIVVLSPVGKQLLMEARFYNPNCIVHEARILLPKINNNFNPNQRFFISFIGNVNSTKGLDWFLDLIDDSKNLKLPEGFSFLLATGSNLKSNVLKRINSLGDQITLINPYVLNDHEISLALQRSITVISMHKNVCQSGVFVECMRHGVPVICRDEIGFSQFYGDCGQLVPHPYGVEEIKAAIGTVIQKSNQYIKGSEDVYNANFSPDLFIKYYKNIL